MVPYKGSVNDMVTWQVYASGLAIVAHTPYPRCKKTPNLSKCHGIGSHLDVTLCRNSHMMLPYLTSTAILLFIILMFYVMEKIPVIGTIVGVIIIVIGVYSLATSFGLQQVTVDDVYPVGDRIQYSFNAPSDAVQTLHVTGDSFMVQIEGPGISRNESYTDETTLTWSHSTEGRSILFISNTGSSDMTVKGTALISSDLIHTAYHGMVIISGIVILGF